MSVSSSDTMSPSRLFSLLTDPSWARNVAPVTFSDKVYEYLLRFCEVNRSGLIERIEKEELSYPTPVLVQRICQLLLTKWDTERDYRFLNLLFKFRTKRYLDYFPKDVTGSALCAQINQTLNRELRYE